MFDGLVGKISMDKRKKSYNERVKSKRTGVGDDGKFMWKAGNHRKDM